MIVRVRLRCRAENSRCLVGLTCNSNASAKTTVHGHIKSRLMNRCDIMVLFGHIWSIDISMQTLLLKGGPMEQLIAKIRSGAR